ncbi:nitrilase and fragile histidine triad fusion protein NitFhit-like [Uloborus diversus]|uniref:nitrilase and fragile histidine triad fusion protein NitFhit-like n=1 Tax=Uloborus diversus TaxID=327109 RepID=UPI00240A0411|nr:nitrilase and fragile histidine triad fusion protein NitFhit-like [Uloborus diversus]
MASENPMTVAVCQLNCTDDREKNFEVCKNFISKAAFHQAKMVFLPECFDHVGNNKRQSIELSEPLDGPLMKKYQQLALEKSIWLSLGGFHEKQGQKDEKVYNSHIIIDDGGNIRAVYRKIHLFDIDIPGGIRLKESDFSIPGHQILPPVKTPVGNIGLGICYDLRFPEFSLSLTKAGADILTYPSAFTVTTGMAHWEVLLRSRAIETQSYVIAAAQTGKHNPKRSSYGHAMVVDPWGVVIACCSSGPGMALAEINLNYVNKVRAEMPIWLHRRDELYGSILSAKDSFDSPNSVMFGQIELLPEQLFHRTRFSVAFVNKKPVVPGHVLVTPVRCVERFADLSPTEVADLFSCVQVAQKIVEEEYSTRSSTISIQDGPDAGQTIPHVHVHILPRRPGDFEENDDIYRELEAHDKSKDVKWRSNEEMAEEADRLRKKVKTVHKF